MDRLPIRQPMTVRGNHAHNYTYQGPGVLTTVPERSWHSLCVSDTRANKMLETSRKT
jgi:hypothetical protein